MKAVMISIRPNWCEMIASGKKIVEVRKTKPKLDPPFKCYIYCTKKHFDDGNGDLVFYGFDRSPEKSALLLPPALARLSVSLYATRFCL
ncbi:MAG: hypothetical protein J6X34_09600 [Clostridia bacterium]|nr:hypothetical protein [Clostridia bacterium]